MTDEEAKKELDGKMFELMLECEAEKSERRKKKISNELTAILRADAALEKQIPEKPIKAKEHIRYSMCYICPNCQRTFSGTGIASYCYHCGQALDWRVQNDS